MTKKRSPTEAAKAQEISVICKHAPEAEDVVEDEKVKVEAQVNVPESGGSGLQTALEEVCKLEGVVGYILKEATTATINLDPELVVEYALLASQALDCYGELMSLFRLGTFRSTLVEYGRLNVLCMLIGESTVSIFMAKNADHARIYGVLSRSG